MMDEVYEWLEQYAGTSYDFEEAFKDLRRDTVFISPFEWRISIENTLSRMDEATDTVDKNWRELPDTLPDRQSLKRLIVNTTLTHIVRNVRDVTDQLNINLTTIKSVDQLKLIVVTLSELIDMLINHELDEILKDKPDRPGLFTKHEEENDESFGEVLDLNRQDMTQLSFNVNAIRQAYFESLDEEDGAPE